MNESTTAASESTAETNNTTDTTNQSAMADTAVSLLNKLHVAADDQEFLQFMMQERMEFLWNSRATPEERKAENIKRAKANRPYFELIESLPDEQLEIINQHSDRVSGEHSEECDFYYIHGFLDGLKAASAARAAG